MARDKTTQQSLQNIPTTPTAVAPLLLAQGADDEVISQTQVQDSYVKLLCTSGQQLEYVVYPGRTHMGLVAEDSPLITKLISWTQDRLAGAPVAVDSCNDA